MQNQYFHIKTYGCQMNDRDSEAVACLLEERGFVPTTNENNADIIILNTCSVRETAENKARGKAGILARQKRRNPKLILVLIGCMAQNKGEQLLAEIPHLDAVVGTDRLHRLPQVIENVKAGEKKQAELETGSEILGHLRGHSRSSAASAFVAVMRGCNQHCAYCIVPRVRGPEKSRPVNEIVDEIKELTNNNGCREVFLLGQNITAYGLAEIRREKNHQADISPFADLLQAVAEIPGIDRIRFTSPHPKHMNDKFIDAVIRLEKVCESFHVPLQSGSDRILRAMRRGYTADEYRERIHKLRQGMPESTFSTDIIVGFPDETAADFEATRKLMAEVNFDMAYIFKYSPRSHTKAALLPDNVPQSVKEERNQILLQELNFRTEKTNQAYVGQRLEVLLEGPSKRNPRRWSGRSRENKVCLVDADNQLQPGQMAKVDIESSTGSSLFGRIVSLNQPEFSRNSG